MLKKSGGDPVVPGQSAGAVADAKPVAQDPKIDPEVNTRLKDTNFDLDLNLDFSTNPSPKPISNPLAQDPILDFAPKPSRIDLTLEKNQLPLQAKVPPALPKRAPVLPVAEAPPPLPEDEPALPPLPEEEPAAPARFKNESLLNILKSKRLLLEIPKAELVLDALLEIDLGLSEHEVNADFNKVLMTQKDTLLKCDDTFFKDEEGHDFEYGEYIVRNNEIPDYKVLKQAAAEQRVKLGLKKADKDVLISILQNNSDECRAYLATRKEIASLNTIPGWTPSALAAVVGAPAPIPGVDILTTEAINNIQKEAFSLLLIKLTLEPKLTIDPKLPEKIKEALLEPGAAAKAVRDLIIAPDHKSLKTAAKLLGVPDTIVNKLPSSLDQRTKRIIAINHYKANEGLTLQSLRDIKILLTTGHQDDNFQRYLESEYKLEDSGDSDPSFVADLKAIFTDLSSRYLLKSLAVEFPAYAPENDPDEYRAYLINALNGSDDNLAENISMIADEDDEPLEYIQVAVDAHSLELRNAMLQRFLVYKSKTASLDVIIKINQAKDVGGLKASLATLGLTDISWFDKTSFDTTKEWAKGRSNQLLEKHIHKLPLTSEGQLANLKSIIFATLKNDKTDLVEFKKQMVKLGIQPVDWLTYRDMPRLKQECRTQAFRMQLSQLPLSKFDTTAHSYLLNIVGTLSEKKQIDLLKQPEQLALLMRAQDESAIRHFLQRTNTNLDKDDYQALINENKHLAACKRIHSFPLAKIMARFNNSLNDEQIDEINAALKEFKEQDKDSAFDDFLNKIVSICKPSQENGIDFSAKMSNAITKNKDSIVKERKHNISLYEYIDDIARHGISTQYRVDLATILLRVDKNTSLNIAEIEVLEEKFNRAPNLELFLTSIVGKPPVEPLYTIQKGLTKEFTHTLFDVIKIKESVRDLNNFSSEDGFKAAVNNVKNKLKLISKGTATPVEYEQEFEFIDGINIEHLADPAFQARAKIHIEQQINEYEGVARECDVMIDKLLHYKNELEAFSALAPNFKIDPIKNSQKFDQFRDLDKRNKELLTKVRAELGIYTNRQEKLSQIVEGVDTALNKRKEYNYKSSHFTVEERDEASITTSRPAQSAPSQPVIIQPPAAFANIINDNVSNNYSLENRLAPGQARDFKYKLVENAGPKESTVTGTFTETHPQIPTPVTYNTKSDQVTRGEARQFTVREPLQQSGPKTEMESRNVEFYLTMAVTIISRLNGKPPSEDKPIQIDGASKDDMRHIWTALVILGEKSSRINFGPEAIRVMPGRDFDPKDEKGFFGFKSDSMYKVYSNKYDELIKEKIQHIESLESARAAHNGAVNKMDRGINKYKQRVTKDREAAANESSPEKTRLEKELKNLTDMTPESEDQAIRMRAGIAKINDKLKKLAESKTGVGQAKDQRAKEGSAPNVPAPEDGGYKI